MGARSVRKPDSDTENQTWLERAGILDCVVKESAVDWLTVTCSAPDRREQFEARGIALLHVQGELGEKITPWRFSGFEGLKTEGVAVGSLPEMHCIRLSGPMAASYWRGLYEMATNCSRIDVQVTVQTMDQQRDLIIAHYKDSLAHFAGWSKPPTLDLRISNRTGTTAYFNTRQSSVYGRIYDKHIQAKMDHYAGCARYEIQCNGRTAIYAAGKLLGFGSDDAIAAQMVSGFFLAKGLDLPWSLEDTTLLSRPRHRTNSARRLRWLEAQVAPCVRQLLQLGLKSEVESALGIKIDDGPNGPP